jgi:hypothetical protein
MAEDRAGVRTSVGGSSNRRLLRMATGVGCAMMLLKIELPDGWARMLLIRSLIEGSAERMLLRAESPVGNATVDVTEGVTMGELMPMSVGSKPVTAGRVTPGSVRTGKPMERSVGVGVGRRPLPSRLVKALRISGRALS